MAALMASCTSRSLMASHEQQRTHRGLALEGIRGRRAVPGPKRRVEFNLISCEPCTFPLGLGERQREGHLLV